MMGMKYSTRSALKCALSEGDCKSVHEILQTSQSLNATIKKGSSLLIGAINSRDIDTFTTLMAFRKYVDINAKWGEWTAISLSCTDVKATHILIQADITITLRCFFRIHKILRLT